MIKSDHATIQLLAVERVLVPFLNNSEHKTCWRRGCLSLINQAFIWEDTMQGLHFWHNLHRESKQLYND